MNKKFIIWWKRGTFLAVILLIINLYFINNLNLALIMLVVLIVAFGLDQDRFIILGWEK